MMKQVYLDNAATTPVSVSVLKAMLPYFKDCFGNPSELHLWGVTARKAVEESRKKVLSFFNLKKGEIVFTSGATERINLAHKGVIEAYRLKFPKIKPHIITTTIEHKATLETIRHLEKLGLVKATYLSVDHQGLISLDQLKKAITKETALISLIYVNNEVGTVQPIGEIGVWLKKINRNRKTSVLFHLDATQAVAYLEVDMEKLNIDLLSFSAHKINGPKGTGALVLREGVSLIRQMDGGNQENSLRSGTENVPGIVGLGQALIDFEDKTKTAKKVIGLRDKLIKGILKIKGASLTGAEEARAPHITSFVFESLEGEALLLMLSDEGIAAASGSACTAGNLSPSHVLTAMGIKKEACHGSLRLSLSGETTEEEIEVVLQVLPKLVKKLRKMAPSL